MPLVGLRNCLVNIGLKYCHLNLFPVFRFRKSFFFFFLGGGGGGGGEVQCYNMSVHNRLANHKIHFFLKIYQFLVTRTMCPCMFITSHACNINWLKKIKMR